MTMNRTEKLVELRKAETKAEQLFDEIKKRALIKSGITEKELNTEVYQLAFELFEIKKYWHKRIVRAGKNTLLPYRHNPPDLLIQEDDIVFLDFGPVFEEWEADFGRTFVVGNNKRKLKLRNDIASAWQEGKAYYLQNRSTITGSQFYAYTKELAEKYDWKFGNIHCGHLIGNFPHEELQGESIVNYIHPENDVPMSSPDNEGNDRFWIYEIHFIDEEQEIGGFFEQLLD